MRKRKRPKIDPTAVKTAGGKQSLALKVAVSVEQIKAWMASPEAVMRVKLPNATTAEWMTFQQYLESQGFERVAD
jgi:hypothetical protein